MDDSKGHTRRDFLQGRAAARALSEKAQELVDAATARLDLSIVPPTTLHIHASRRAMACEFAIQYHESDRDASDCILAAFDLIEALEDQMTIYREQSEVITINELAFEEPIEVEIGLFSLLQVAERLFRDTHGAFDITSTPLSRIWGFLRREGRFPGEEEIRAVLEKVGFDKVNLDLAQKTVRFREDGVEINLNSIGKGYALDRTAAMMDDCGLTDYLWHGGSSSILARGVNRADAQEAWTLGLRHPLEPQRRLGEFHLRNQALGTAGGATQNFEHEGKLYSHVIDPRTGWPAEGIFTSTVIAPTAAEADALATAFYVMGVEATAKYCEEHADVAAVLVCPEKTPDKISLHEFGLGPEDWTRFESVLNANETEE